MAVMPVTLSPLNEATAIRQPANRWKEAWPDVLAFGAGLALAWHFQWRTTDLVWSLWLSSLLVGYAMIVWNIFGPVLAGIHEARVNGAPPLAQAGLGGLHLIGGLFMLAFFTVHFGGFHFVHSAFLSAFFPLNEGGAKNFPGFSTYLEVFQRYWWFVPAAAIAERQAFKWPQPPGPADTSVKAADIARRKAAGDKMMGPYKNVIRMHLLIFFFAFAHFMHLESYWIYAVVYAVYFFPWRLLKTPTSEADN